MLIQIETENLIKEKLTPNDYIILKLLFEQNYQLLQQLFNSDIMSNLIVLEADGYLKVTCEELNWNKISTEVSLRQKTIDLFIVKQTGFYRFWNTYPSKVPNRPPLKTIDYNTQEGLLCKQKWDKITNKDPIIEEQIIKALEIEIKIRKQSNNLSYMMLVTTWLNKREWEKYIHLAEEEIKENNEKTEGI